MPITREQFRERKYGKNAVAVEGFLRSQATKAFTRDEICGALTLHPEDAFDALRDLLERGTIDTTGAVDVMETFGSAADPGSVYYTWAAPPFPPSEDVEVPANQEQSPNDQRSDALNPNNPAFKAALDNRGDQLNPNHPAYRAGRKGD